MSDPLDGIPADECARIEAAASKAFAAKLDEGIGDEASCHVAQRAYDRTIIAEAAVYRAKQAATRTMRVPFGTQWDGGEVTATDASGRPVPVQHVVAVPQSPIAAALQGLRDALNGSVRPGRETVVADAMAALVEATGQVREVAQEEGYRFAVANIAAKLRGSAADGDPRSTPALVLTAVADTIEKEEAHS